ncbi:IclR family transcriptional regulator [Natrarchaeobius oligotrophus]|uniref:IclR family transcriptional regulator n=1 Tax=Natrarchaeobius chitinivorans TaxID=1679083 RepID=A0A3N6MM23_NATCH|nr:IclR family transcriptional regulator [Natrarchaeobius chitinivorans]RQH02575.1 IclR family transcriptional regulator [Natrarchaeobius chitinivorans]
MSEQRSDSIVEASITTFEVIEALKQLDGGRVNEVAEYLDRHPSTVYRHLNTLSSIEYVTKRGDQYQLGMQFLTLGGFVQGSDPAYEMAKTKVEELADRTGERAQFIIEEHGRRIYLHTATGEQAVRTDSQLGKRGPLHCSAAGKAILAELPEEYLADVLTDAGLEPVTPNTVIDHDELMAELEEIRETGVAFNREESTEGLNAVGTGVVGPDGEVIGGLSVSGPAHRLTGDRLQSDVPDLLLGVANELELKIEYELR